MKFKNIKKKAKRKEFPSNSRSITEHSRFDFPKISHTTLFKIYRGVLKVFVVIIFIIAVIIVAVDFRNNLQAKQSIDRQRITLEKDLNFWKNFISKNQNYPDAYFQASILEYRLGNTTKAKMYIEKGLILDPNSKNGRKIERLLK